MSPNLGFTISSVPATREAGKTLSAIESAAIQNENEPLSRLLWPAPPQSSTSTAPTTPAPEQEPEKDEDREPFHTIDMLSDPGNIFVWAIEEASGQPVGYIWWQHAKGRTEAEWAATYANRHRPERMNKALMDATSGVRFLKRAKLLGEQDTFILKELYVHPDQQRKGLGSLMVQRGVLIAEERGLPAYVEASAAGLRLYTRYGFREVDRVTVDLEPWGGNPGEMNSYGLLWRPAKKERD